ncbi:MAG TPA: mandelate racemase/muconate lactonizing enzyme family protein [Dehalococcoidia bacterium]
MQITDIRVRVFEVPHQHAFAPTWQPAPSRSHRITLVEVHTDEGITGYGSGGVVTSTLQAAKQVFLGKDPFAIEQHVAQLRSLAFLTGRPWPVELALWDIMGKALGQPVYRLLGGYRDRIPAYASTGELRPAAQRRDDVLRLREEGFRAVKLRFHSPRPEDDLPVLAAARQAVGGSMALMVDANQAWYLPGADVSARWDLRTALRMVRALEEYDVSWLEEPLPAYDYDGLAELRRRSRVPIAGGELNQGLHELKIYLEKDCYDVYQPDATFAGGIWECRKVAAMAEARGRQFTPHMWTNGIGMLANLHLAASVPNCPWIEFPYDPPAWTPEVRDALLREPLRIDADGCLRVPDRPGLGIELDEEQMARYEVTR